MFSKTRLLSLTILVTVVAIAAIGIANLRPAEAQTSQYVYSASFVCGDHIEPYGRRDDDTLSYEKSTKVANYAFKLDVTNPGSVVPATVTGWVNVLDVEAAPPPGRWPVAVAPLAMPVAIVPQGDATMIDCIEIAEAILGISPPPPARPYFSGIVTVKSNVNLIAWSTHTMCSGGSTLGAAAADRGFCGEANLTHLPGDDMAGLGASIDVERVEPVIVEQQ